MAYVITSPCGHEKAAECVDSCPVDCIIEGADQYYIDPDLCIDCGACEAVCPVEAIYPEEDVPIEEFRFIQLSRDFFR